MMTENTANTPAPTKSKKTPAPYVRVRVIAKKPLFRGNVLRQPGAVFVTENARINTEKLEVIEELGVLSEHDEHIMRKAVVETPWNGLMEGTNEQQ